MPTSSPSADARYRKTIYACFIGYVIQAIVNNFAPLLFLTFQRQYNIPLSRITLLVTVNFGIQLLVDLLSVKFIDRIGYRASLLTAHGLAALGLLLLTLLPELPGGAFPGLLISVAVYAVGGGLLEVLLSPVVEACPTANKERAMSLLHSFYCWGHVGVVLVSTLYFSIFGIERWKLLACFWAVFPLANALLFAQVPIAPLIGEGERSLPVRSLFSQKLFWLFLLMMVCAGASEQAVGQWASAFAEKALGAGKAAGDLAGPMSFALAMGISRALYGKFGERIDLNRFMAGSGVLCIAAYLVISLISLPAAGFAGCALCGLSVGILWPGTFSQASASIKKGGTAMFALLALAGDLGCSAGPTLAGLASGLCGDNLRMGILAATIFPALLVIGIFSLAGHSSRS